MSIDDLLLNRITKATPSEVDRVRYPTTEFTTAYLNDEIKFSTDERFTEKTVTKQLAELPSFRQQMNRDFAEFLQVDKNNDEQQLLVVNLYSAIVNRTSYQNVILSRSAFSEFGI
jgi:hypothetical protein